MTPCRRPDVAELLGSYVLGACSDSDAELVRAHVARCASCTDTLAALAPAREGLLADVERAAPPVDLKSRVMGQVRADAPPSRRHARRSARSGGSRGCASRGWRWRSARPRPSRSP